MAYVHCIHCAREVRPRQHAIACDVCGFWQHRTCSTGISLLAYREAVNSRGKISFTCGPCRELNQVPVTIGVSDQDQDEPEDPPFLELSVPVTIGVSDQDQVQPEDPPFLELSIPSPSIGDLSTDIPVAESTEIEVDPYGAIMIPDIPDADTSFDISDRNIDPVNIIDEESVHDVLTETMVEYRGITYSVLEESSQKHTRLLVSSLGYSYGVKRDNVNSTLWRCTSRSLNVKCKVTIRQQGNLFVQSYAQHTHPAVSDRQLKAQVYAKLRRAAREQLFTPALKIAEDAILESSGPDTVCLSKKALLKRVANRTRAKLRPATVVQIC